MRYLIPLVFAVLLIQPCNSCSLEGIPKLATYKNAKYCFEVGYPEQWKAEISEGKKGVSCKWSKNYQSMQVFASPLNKTKQSLIELLKSVDKTYLLLDKTQMFRVIDLNGKRDHQALIGYGHRKVEELAIMVTKRGNTTYTVILSDPDELQEELALALFKTFKFTK